MNKIGLAFACAMATCASFAYETNTWIGATAANAPASAYSWSDPANWSLNHLPATDEKVKFPAGSAVYWVKMPDELNLNYIYSTANLRLIGEKVIGSKPSWTSKFYIHYNSGNCGWMFSDLDVVTQGGSSENPYFYQTFELAGRLICNNDITPASGALKLRLDRFATSTDPVRTNDLQIGTHQVYPGDASFSVFVAGAPASESAWKLTAGSPYAELADASAVATAVGATVTGDGIAPGTFVRRRFDETTLIELSQPATNTLTSTLSFGAFNPDARLCVSAHSSMGTGGSRIRLGRRMDGDVLSYEVFTLSASSKGFYWGHGLLPADQDAAGWLPGKLILHNVSAVKNNTAPYVDRLNDCHIEFGGAVNSSRVLTGEPTVFPASRIVGFETANATARMTVGEGKTGAIEKFVRFTGTVVKDGAGSLSINVAEAANTGAVKVEAGTLTLTKDESVEEAMTLSSVEIAAGATFKIPAEGLTVETLVAGEGATVEGPGTLTVTGSLTGMPILDGEIRFVPPPMPSLARADLVAGLKPIWIIDATDYGSAKMETYVENGTNFLSKWYDSTGSGEYFKSRGGSGFPLGGADCWIVEDANRGMPYVDMGPYLRKPNGSDQTFLTEGPDRSLRLYGANDVAYRIDGGSETSDVNKRKALKAAFFVVGTQYGGGTLLGSYGNSYMSSYPLNHGRGAEGMMFAYSSDAWNDGRYFPQFTDAYLASGYTYFTVNGETVNPCTTTWQNGFSQISYASTKAISASTLLGCVGTSGTYEINSGGLMWGEVIALEEKPTVAQAQAIEAYLNVKWFGVRNPGYFAEYTRLELHDAETSLTGSDGTVYAGALAGFGKLTANLQLTGDTFDVLTDATGKIGTFTVTGTAQLPAAGTVRVGGERKPAAGSYVILASGGLTCDLADWTIVRYPGDTREYTLAKDGDSIVLTVRPNGLMLLVR